MKYSNYAVSYLIDVETSKTIVEDISRKKIRKIARKKYREEYMIAKKYVIISGEDKKEAMNLYKIAIAKKDDSKKVTLTVKSNKKTKKPVIVKKAAKKTDKTLTSIFNDLVEEEEASIKKANKKVK